MIDSNPIQLPTINISMQERFDMINAFLVDNIRVRDKSNKNIKALREEKRRLEKLL